MTAAKHAPVATTWTIVLPMFYGQSKPLTFEHTKAGGFKLTLTGNSRHHWAKRSSVTKRIRQVTAMLLRAEKIPPQEFVTATVELHYPEKGVKYLKDRDNLFAMGKPMWDALQPPREARFSPTTGKVIHGPIPGAGIIPGDSDKHVRKEAEIIRGSLLPECHTPFKRPVIVMRVAGV